MLEQLEHRREARLAVPRHCQGAGRDATALELLDLSPAGARIVRGGA